MKLRKVIAIVSIMVMAFIVTGCGDSATTASGYAAGEDFTLDGNTYTLEKWVRYADEDTDSEECRGVAILIEGDSAPIIIPAAGEGNPQCGVDMVLVKGDGNTISPIGISFDGIDDKDKYGVRMTFKYMVPKGEDLPQMATMKNNNNQEETVDLNLTTITEE